MTLNTTVFIHDQVDPHETFRYCQGLLTPFDIKHREPSAQSSVNKQDETWRAGVWIVEPGNPWSLDNEPMQDLPAWLMTHYRPGEAYRTPAQSAEHDDCNWDETAPPCDKTEHEPPCWMQINFDTAYGYRGPDGLGCGDLHAVLVGRLGNWLDERNVRWSWENEFTSEVHGGPDRYERLIDLVSGGFEATAWFTTTVMPAIASDILGGAK